ncbi:MAG TPA: hypothetical protein PLD27_12125 [bacterium]|nr:hypothetical protein [bacterium]
MDKEQFFKMDKELQVLAKKQRELNNKSLEREIREAVKESINDMKNFKNKKFFFL